MFRLVAFLVACGAVTDCTTIVHPISKDAPGSRAGSAARTLVIGQSITVHEFGEFVYPAVRYPITFADSYGVYYEAPAGIRSLATGQRVRGGFYSSFLDPGKIEAYDGGPDAPMPMHGCVPWASYHLEH